MHKYAIKYKITFYSIILLIISIFFLTSCSNVKSTKSFEEGKRLLDQKKYIEAIKSFEKSLKLNPKNHQAVEAIGLCYGDLKDYNKAVEYFEKAVQMKPKNKLYLFNLAVTYLQIGEYSKAKEVYQKILYIDKNNRTAKEALEKLRKNGY